MSIVRRNLLEQENYTPYCGELHCDVMPRTFFNGEQFECPKCKWESSYEPEFIEKYILVGRQEVK
jgi:hypothetical protein